MSSAEARSPWLYVFAAPLVLVTVSSLVTDPRQLGDRSSAADEPVAALLGLGVFVLALVGGVWRYSVYSHRTAVAILQVVLAIGSLGGLATGLITTIGWWDLVIDVAWLVTITAQVFGKGR